MSLRSDIAELMRRQTPSWGALAAQAMREGPVALDRHSAIAKATIDTPGAAGALLDPTQSARLSWRIKEKSPLGNLMRLERRTSASGEINRAHGNSRIMRRATENTDDGYRAGVTFPTVPYTAVKVRLPWEVTEEVFHENIEGEAIEGGILNDMELQFALDWDDLDVNGDTASADPFVQIDDGLLKLFATGQATRVNGGTINAGAISKAHFFEAQRQLPNRYRADPGLRWLMSPNRHARYIEYLTDRATGAGDAALLGTTPEADRPLGIAIEEIPSYPDSRITLANPRNFVRVVTWDIRRRKVTGETDKELAATDKRFYVFHLKRDVVVEDSAAVVDVYGLV